jgi:glycoside/pentoside/hexuronide:cation symporter, GPH family
VLLFNVPNLSAVLTTAWVGTSYFALATLFSLFAVPYIAIPAQVSPDQESLARMVSWRMVLVMVGILVGAAGAPTIVAASGGGRAGYGAMGWAIGAMCLVTMSLPLIMLQGRDRPAHNTKPNMPSTELFADMAASLSNARFRRLCYAYLAQAIAFGAFSAIVPYVVTKGLGRADADIGVALGVYLLATVFAVPFWSWLGRKIGLRKALNWAALSYGFSTAAIGVIVLLNIEWSRALCLLAFAGIPFAGLQVLPFTLVGDIIRADGSDGEGRFTGIWTAVEKLGLAFGAVIVGETIDLIHGNTPVGVGIFLCIVPIALCLISMQFLRSMEFGLSAAELHGRSMSATVK